MADTPLSYWDYLQLDTLLALQGGADGDDRALVPDELLFVITHQTYELWFKQVLRELSEAIALFRAGPVPEERIPWVVHHLRRAAQILHLAVAQFEVIESLTPQDFLGFRDKLVPASGFQSFQMREMELLLGLDAVQRVPYGKTDTLAHIRGLAVGSRGGAHAVAALDAASAAAARGDTLRAALLDWLHRTPIDGSTPGSAADDAVVDGFMSGYAAAFQAYQDDQAARLRATGLSAEDEIAARFAASTAAAVAFFDATDRPAEERAFARRVRAGLLYIESHRHLPLLAWPRLLVDTVVELEEQLVLWRNRHARMVERIIGRRVGTGGSAGVEYLDKTTGPRIFGELWTVRTLLLPRQRVPAPQDAAYYYRFPPGSP
jgi:tryptophan 2,3-dioxygenase